MSGGGAQKGRKTPCDHHNLFIQEVVERKKAGKLSWLVKREAYKIKKRRYVPCLFPELARKKAEKMLFFAPVRHVCKIQGFIEGHKLRTRPSRAPPPAIYALAAELPCVKKRAFVVGHKLTPPADLPPPRPSLTYLEYIPVRTGLICLCSPGRLVVSIPSRLLPLAIAKGVFPKAEGIAGTGWSAPDRRGAPHTAGRL